MSDILATRYLTISHPYISSQSKGCLALFQFRHVLFYLRGGNRSQAPVEIHLFAPRQTRDAQGNTLGYRCKGFFLRIGRRRFGDCG